MKRIKDALSLEKFLKIREISINAILENIKSSLRQSDINFDSWFFESSLIDDKSLIKAIDFLNQNNYTYQRDNALWFKSKDFGDEKDRVLIKENKDHTHI